MTFGSDRLGGSFPRGHPRRGATRPLPPLSTLSLSDLEMMRGILSGASVIDWHRFASGSRYEVLDFLHAQELRPESDGDLARLWSLHARAAQYLELSFSLRLPREVVHPTAIEDLFLFASRRDAGSDPEVQRSA